PSRSGRASTFWRTPSSSSWRGASYSGFPRWSSVSPSTLLPISSDDEGVVPKKAARGPKAGAGDFIAGASPRLGWAGSLIVCACDAQVTRDSRGERLVKIRGDIVSEPAAVAADAALLWWTAPPAGGSILGTRVATEGAFPSAFTLSVYRLP